MKPHDKKKIENCPRRKKCSREKITKLCPRKKCRIFPRKVQRIAEFLPEKNNIQPEKISEILPERTSECSRKFGKKGAR